MKEYWFNEQETGQNKTHILKLSMRLNQWKGASESISECVQLSVCSQQHVHTFGVPCCILDVCSGESNHMIQPVGFSSKLSYKSPEGTDM